MTQLATIIHKEEKQTFGIFGLRLSSIKSHRGYSSNAHLLDHHKRDLSKFVNILYDPHRAAVFMIRTIVDPQGSQKAPGKIDIVFLVKFLVSQSSEDVEAHAKSIYRNIKLIVGGTFSEYVWKEIEEEDELEYYLSPFSWPEAFIAEVEYMDRREYQPLLARAHGAIRE